MRAIVKTKKGKDGICLMEMSEPIPTSGEIKVKVVAAGICGTDIHIMKDEGFYYNPPVIMGHEYVGIVEDIGENVNNFKKGDYVISHTAAKTCGECQYCQKDLLMLCDKRLSIGSGTNGAFAEYLTIPASLAFKVPDDIENKEELAIAEPVACVVRAVIERSIVKAGDIVLISGPGTIGLIAVQLAKLQGAFVIVSGLPEDQHRLKLASELGADVVVSHPEKLNQTIKEIEPYGVDVAFECSGAAPSARACLNSLKKQGIYSQVGLFGKPININMDDFLYKELYFTNSFASERSSWRRLLRLIKNKQFNFTPLISEKLSLEDWEKAFNKVINKEGYKILLIP